MSESDMRVNVEKLAPDVAGAHPGYESASFPRTRWRNELPVRPGGNAALVRRGIEVWSRVRVHGRRRLAALVRFRRRGLPVRSGRLCELAVRRFLGQAECAQALRIGANGKLLNLVLVHRLLRIARSLLLRSHRRRSLLRVLRVGCHG